MISIEALKALLAAGGTAEMIIAMVEAEVTAEQIKIDARRAKDAERQRRKRHAESRGVTRTSRDIPDEAPKNVENPPKDEICHAESPGQAVTGFPPFPPSPSPCTLSPIPLYPPFPVSGHADALPPEPQRIVSTKSKAEAKPLRLDDWIKQQTVSGRTEDEIGIEWGEWAMTELAMSSAEINAQMAKFTDYWKAKGGGAGRKSDWFATWRNWCRDRERFNPKGGKPYELQTYRRAN